MEGLAGEDIEAGIKRTADEFSQSLTEGQQKEWSPCLSAADLLNAVRQLDQIASGGAIRRHLSAIQKFTDQMEPFFAIGDIFVSSHPEYAALVWGSLRLVLKVRGRPEIVASQEATSNPQDLAELSMNELTRDSFYKWASNYSSFFEKFAQMLSNVADALPQYHVLLELCKEKAQGENRLDPNTRRMRDHVNKVYKDIFEILTIAAEVFTKSDGKKKRKARVAGGLIWKPFETRFGDVLKRLTDHRETVHQQLVIWHAKEHLKEIARSAADRKTHEVERKEDVEEQRLAREQRLLERERNSENWARTTKRLSEIHEKMEQIEEMRKGMAVDRLRKWLNPPPYANRFNRHRKRTPGTTTWLLDEPMFKRWEAGTGESSPTRTKFGSNMLWVQGHPGAGKSVLAASIVEEFLDRPTTVDGSGPGAYYFFFDYERHKNPDDAFRSIMSQIFWISSYNIELLDRLTFAAANSGQGQQVASSETILGLLQLCLGDDDVLVFDGIDECNDSEEFVESLLQICNKLPKIRLSLFSRINVPALKLSVLKSTAFTIPKSRITEDISSFCIVQLDDMFERSILPESSTGERDALAHQLCVGADGMFLWARLMMKGLRSSWIPPSVRLSMIKEINQPEGLVKMYDRIIDLICGGGTLPMNLASITMKWLAFAVVPLTTRQLLQAMVAGGDLDRPDQWLAVETVEFQEYVMMACAGLVEPYMAEPTPEQPEREHTLRFIHLSLKELIQNRESTRTGVAQGKPAIVSTKDAFASSLLSPERVPHLAATHGAPLSRPRSRSPSQQADPASLAFQRLVMGPMTAQISLATCALRQLIFYTPAQPLAGAFNERVSEVYMNEHHCFTLYAATHWLSHLRESLGCSHSNVEESSAAILSFIQTLSTFLANPRVLSAWLEAFYTARYQRLLSRYDHPPIQVVSEWLQVARGMCSVEFEQTIDGMEETFGNFTQDLAHILRIWNTQLAEHPQVIWDEMTSFAKSEFFFMPNSVKFKVQQPEAPKLRNLSSDAVAQISRTWPDGDIKGVLSIWAPCEVYDRESFTRLHMLNRNKNNDIEQYCKGWRVTYDIYRLKEAETSAARLEFGLDAEDVLSPILNYLDYPLQGGIDFPLAISNDVLSFCVLQTLYVIHPATDTKDTRVFSDRIEQRAHHRPDFTWKARRASLVALQAHSYLLHFSPNGRLLAYHERREDLKQVISVFAVRSDPNVPLFLERLTSTEVSHEADELTHIRLHPNQALLVFHARFGLDKFIFLWQFRKASAEFSSSGSHLVIQPDFPEGAAPIVIECPESSAETDDQADMTTTYPETASAHQGMGDTAETQITYQQNASSDLIQTTHASQNVTLVSGSGGGATEISLSTRTEAGTLQTTKILAFPSGSPGSRRRVVQGGSSSGGGGDMLYTAMPPRAPGENYVVSVDMDRRRQYPLVAGRDRDRTTAAAVVERHPAYVVGTTSKPTTSMARALAGSGSTRSPMGGGGDGSVLDVGTGWVPCQEVSPHAVPVAAIGDVERSRSWIPAWLRWT